MLYRVRLWLSPATGEEAAFLRAIGSMVGYAPRNRALYTLAFRRKTKGYNPRDASKFFERLEFLGDAILGALMADFLYKKYPDGDEGYLTNMRSKVVSRNALNAIAKELRLTDYVDPGQGGGRRQQPGSSLPGNTLEALIGAVYLDLGMRRTRRFVEQKLVDAFINMGAVERQVISYKSVWIEWAQRHKRTFRFELADSSGQNHKLNFTMALFLDGEKLVDGTGPSKKKAEEDAARKACKLLKIRSGEQQVRSRN